MRICSFLSIALVGLLGSLGRADDKPSADAEKLKGKWKVVEAVRDGDAVKDVPPVAFELVTFGGTQRSLRFDLPAKLIPADVEGEFVKIGHTLDATAKPKRVTISRSFGGKAFSYPGIYELDGDRLTVCLALNDWHSHTATRKTPDKFESLKGSGRTLVVLERVKK